jgi:hypothetical protein
MVSHQVDHQRARKAILVALGQWAVDNGRGWIVRAVDVAIAREGLRDE